MGEKRRKKGDGRKETGERRREKGDGRKETEGRRWEKRDGRKETGDRRLEKETGDIRQETGEGQIEIVIAYNLAGEFIHF